MKQLNPQKYIDLANKVQQEAKVAAIALLRDKVEGHCIDPKYKANNTCEHWLFCFDGNDDKIQLHAYGLNKNGELCFKA